MMNVCADKIIANEFVGENINKANIDLDNLSENGKKIFFPSDTFLEVTITVPDTLFVAPANGYLVVYGVTNGHASAGVRFFLGNSNVCIKDCKCSNDSTQLVAISTIVKKQQEIKVTFINISATRNIKFYYMEGEI